MRIIETVATKPPSAQTSVERIRGLMPDSRARSGLPAAARTDRPSIVRLRNQPSPMAMIGAAIRMSSSGPLSCRLLPMFQVEPDRLGERRSRAEQVRDRR